MSQRETEAPGASGISQVSEPVQTGLWPCLAAGGEHPGDSRLASPGGPRSPGWWQGAATGTLEPTPSVPPYPQPPSVPGQHSGTGAPWGFTTVFSPLLCLVYPQSWERQKSEATLCQ